MSKRKPEWNDAQIFDINKQPTRCTSLPYDSTESAMRKSGSPYVISLDGEWRFHWVACPAERIKDFYLPGFNDHDWKLLAVPSQWELNGYGVPIYAPFHMPPSLHKRNMPNIDARDNPVGAYRYVFNLPAEWEEREIYLQFNGVCSAFYVWINGQFVGYSQDSMLPAEFHISPYLQDGENLIAVEVYRFSDGSYLENQDMWFLSGIFRSVRLLALSKTAIRDFSLRNEFSENFNTARLEVSLEILSHGQSQGLQPTLNLELVLTWNGEPAARQDVCFSSQSVSTVMEVANPRLWSAETPNIYDLLLILRDEAGKVLDIRHAYHGFRQIEIRDRQLWLNGRSIKLKGVNRHDFDPTSGHVMSLERLQEDILIMKRNNINALRCSHYPDDERLYDLCDRFGIYVIDEANIENHGYRDAMRGDIRWLPAMRARLMGMIERDKNHPCIIMWSLGNESSTDERFKQLTDLVHLRDSRRPVHYEQDYRGEYADVFSMMYPTPADLESIASGGDYKIRSGIFRYITIHGEHARHKPLLLCEYAHAMGNSLGNFQDYQQIFAKYPQCIGGFIWDFADQGIQTTSTDGKLMWAYGGDLGDPYHFSTFGCNGILAADRSPHPALTTVKKGYQNIVFTAVDILSRRILLTNAFHFQDLSAYVLHWTVEVDGMAHEEGQFDLPSLAAQSSQEIEIPFNIPSLRGKSEAWLNLSVRLRQPVLWAEAGYEIAWEQFRIPLPQKVENLPVMASHPAEPLRIQPDNHMLRIEGQGWKVSFDQKEGSLRQYWLAGSPTLARGLLPNLWRVQIDNDISAAIIYQWARAFVTHQPWRRATEKQRCISFTLLSQSDENCLLQSRWKFPRTGSVYTTLYKVSADGLIEVESTFTPNKPLERMGMQLALSGLDWQAAWFGLGPEETMPDRTLGARVGRYERAASQLTHNYIRPQENGNRSEVRWLALYKTGVGRLQVKAEGESLFCFSLWPYSQQDLANATHIHELPQRDFLTLNIDHRQKGVGGDVPAGGAPHDDYILKGGVTYQYSFTIQGVAE